MIFLVHTDALIFDLRENHGTSPAMVQPIESYLLNPHCDPGVGPESYKWP